MCIACFLFCLFFNQSKIYWSILKIKLISELFNILALRLLLWVPRASNTASKTKKDGKTQKGEMPLYYMIS